jgi:2-polyprenyl-3-methyl-5-hydroxy-6-metoxy-1,4-benzoquinol methylase
VDSIGQAYQKYYTHGADQMGTRLQRLKRRLINECWSHWLRTDIHPRLGIPDGLAAPLLVLHSKIPPPFELEALAGSRRGTLMDVGCGDGSTLRLAARLGWKTTGLEFDANAVRSARADGLNVVEGTYKKLEAYSNQFDCVICSHLIEHVHEPVLLLRLIRQALKEGGTALISCPNSQSYVRRRFGSSWRGLEAPRHLAIPSLRFLIGELERLGFTVDRMDPVGSTTSKQSEKIQEMRKRSPGAETSVAPEAPLRPADRRTHPDLIQLVCRKN